MQPPELGHEQLLQFLPERVAATVFDSQRELLRGRRLEVTVLSCDVGGFRPLAEADPEAALPLLNEILAALAETVREQDGTLMSFPGDGMLAVFGAPIEAADHAAQAAAARDAITGPVLERLNRAVPGPGEPISVSAAVASGPVLAGVIGAAPRWEYAAIGEPTSRAIAGTTGSARH